MECMEEPVARTRRSFLASVGAAPMLPALASPAASRDGAPYSRFDPWVEVSAAHLRHNVDEVRRRVAPRPILAVIKNDGYGLGLVNVARVLEPLEAVAGFAVVKLHEAVSLRDVGIRKPVLLMGPFDEAELELI